MKKEHVVILYENSLFAKGLLSILKREGIVEVEDLERRKEKAGARMTSLHPEVVIVEGDDPRVDASDTVRELLKKNPKGCAIGVNLNTGDAVIYMGMRLPATEKNLLRAVKIQIGAERNRKSA